MLALSNIDYFLIAIIAFASSFFGAFGKELADFLIKLARRVRNNVMEALVDGLF